MASPHSIQLLGVIAGGRVRPVGHAPTLREFCRRAGDGAEVLITVEEKKEQRSAAQNRTLWGPVYDQILEAVMLEQGYRPDEANTSLDVGHVKQLVHYGLLARRFGYATDPVTGMQVPARTSSELNTSEFAEYLKWLQTFCADELHIPVDLPDDVRAA